MDSSLHRSGRRGGLAAAAWTSSLLLSGALFAQEAPPAQAPSGQTPRAEAREWEFSVSGNAYIFPGEGDFVLGIATADRGPLHLEARYNYEDQNTGSVWGGWNWSTGEKVEFGITPMLGAVFGDTDGIAPGFELSLTWKLLDYYLESELLFDLNDRDDDFIYSWSELGVSPLDWLRAGLVAQRTRTYETGLDIQRGLFAQTILGPVSISLDWFNPASEDEFIVALVDFEF